jgi:hypothetical protein
MPVHDWTRVDAGIFRAFHTLWIADLMGALNTGLLPEGYYALAEQVATRMQIDVLTLRSPAGGVAPLPEVHGGVSLAEAPPAVHLSLRPDPRHRPRRSLRRGRHLVIRHISGHQGVALIEIVSPSNKDRRAHVRQLTEMVVGSLEAGVHVLLVDLLPATTHDPQGLHGAVWAQFDTTPYAIPADRPLTLASYAWDGEEPRAFLEPVAVGQPLIDMPLFLTADRYVNVPLEPTYLSAYRGMPEWWRRVLERADENLA